MVGTIMEVMVILSYPLQLQTDLDPCILDKDNNIIQGWLENKSCHKWLYYHVMTNHTIHGNSYVLDKNRDEKQECKS